MALKPNNSGLNGLNPLAHMGVNATQPPQFNTYNRAPTTRDFRNFTIGAEWLDQSKNPPDVYKLVSVANNQAKWVLLTGGTSGTVTELTGNDGNPATPLLGNINIRGDGGIINITRSPDNNSLLVEAQGNVATVYQADSGSATPTLNTLNVLGGTGISTSAVGNSVVITATGASGITSIEGNSGGPQTGPAITIQGTTGASGATVRFAGAGNVLTLNVSNASNTFIGPSCGNTTNTADNHVGLGIGTFASVTSGSSNIGVGNAVCGNLTTATSCVCIGTSSGGAITSGSRNTAIGQSTLVSVTTGRDNTVVGANALVNVATGEDNTAIGAQSGDSLTGSDSDNIHINNRGIAGENNTLKIGRATGTGRQELNRAFIHGIRGITTGVNDAIAVLVDSAGQLGTVSSSARYKDNIADIGQKSAILHDLRPRQFTYKQDETHRINFGLVAEEVEQVCPALVIYKDGQPETVRYHELVPLLLNELQRLKKQVDKLEKSLVL